MKSTKPSEWVFYIISYSPQPEDNECVNVGLLVTGPKRAFVTYDQKFPKLQSVGTKEDEACLQLTFDSIQKMSNSPNEVLEEFRIREPQFLISQPHELLEKPKPDLLDRLKKRFLSRPKLRLARKKTIESQKKIESQLDMFLLSKYKLSRSCLQEKANLRNFVSKELSEKLPTQKHLISRFYDARNKLFFIDTISLQSPIDSIMNRFIGINKTFWQYGKHLEDIRFFTGKKPLRVGIILNGIQHPSRDLEDTHNFVKDQWKVNAETIVDSDKVEDVEDLAKFFSTIADL